MAIPNHSRQEPAPSILSQVQKHCPGPDSDVSPTKDLAVWLFQRLYPE